MKKFFIILFIITTAAIIPLTGCTAGSNNKKIFSESSEIKVGLLFSTFGTSSIVEQSMLDAAVMAFDEINETGGINGRKITYLHENYSSDPSIAGNKVRKLIEHDGVVATVGCYSSASRQQELPVLKENDSLLIYPAYTEGEEEEGNVIYTGAMPNQLISDFIPWLINRCGKRVFFVGSDYRFPVISNKKAKKIVDENGGLTVGEEYAEIGAYEFSNIWDKIEAAKPDFIFCDLIGDSLLSFYREYKERGLSPDNCPIASTTMDEVAINNLGSEYVEGHYMSAAYFINTDTPASKEFTDKYYERFDDATMPTGLAEATYNSCYLLAEALKKTGDGGTTQDIIDNFSGLEFEAPQGRIKVDEQNHCTWLYSRFAVCQGGDIKILYESEYPIRPEPWIDIR